MIEKKNASEAKIMIEGGQILARIKKDLAALVVPGESGKKIDLTARKLIESAGADVSFAMEPGYHWATCIDINDGVVHGIPTDYAFKEGDVIGIDVGLRYRGFHLDTALTTVLKPALPQTTKFLDAGRETLKLAIASAKPGHHISDISVAIEKNIRRHGYSPVAALAGHGVGHHLHEDPLIPCVSTGEADRSPLIEPGMTLAIEVIYTQGSGEVAYGGQLAASGRRIDSDDGWTIVSLDGTIAAVFEDSILITESGPRVLTR